MFQVSPMNWISYLMFILFFFMYLFEILKEEKLHYIYKYKLKIYVK